MAKKKKKKEIQYGTSQTEEDLHHLAMQCFHFTDQEIKAQGLAPGYLF